MAIIEKYECDICKQIFDVSDKNEIAKHEKQHKTIKHKNKEYTNAISLVRSSSNITELKNNLIAGYNSISSTKITDLVLNIRYTKYPYNVKTAIDLDGNEIQLTNYYSGSISYVYNKQLSFIDDNSFDRFIKKCGINTLTGSGDGTSYSSQVQLFTQNYPILYKELEQLDDDIKQIEKQNLQAAKYAISDILQDETYISTAFKILDIDKQIHALKKMKLEKVGIIDALIQGRLEKVDLSEIDKKFKLLHYNRAIDLNYISVEDSGRLKLNTEHVYPNKKY